MVSEDMSEFLPEIPGCYYLVGSMNEERGLTWGHHTCRFDIDEDSLAIGIETMTRTAQLLGATLMTETRGNAALSTGGSRNVLGRG